MTDDIVRELKLDLEFLDGSMRAQMVAIRAILRENPKALENLQLFLEQGEKEGFNLNHTEEQDRGLLLTLKNFCK